MVVVLGTCIHLWKPLGIAYELMDVHLWKVGVRPFPVRKEVEMKTKTPGSPKIDQHIKKKSLRKRPEVSP